MQQWVQMPIIALALQHLNLSFNSGTFNFQSSFRICFCSAVSTGPPPSVLSFAHMADHACRNVDLLPPACKHKCLSAQALRCNLRNTNSILASLCWKCPSSETFSSFKWTVVSTAARGIHSYLPHGTQLSAHTTQGLPLGCLHLYVARVGNL
jgi:hypothetical protein